jgi:hypothetical protein
MYCVRVSLWTAKIFLAQRNTIGKGVVGNRVIIITLHFHVAAFRIRMDQFDFSLLDPDLDAVKLAKIAPFYTVRMISRFPNFKNNFFNPDPY